MKRYSKKNPNNFPVPSIYDLFGDIPVTQNEIIAWCESVVHLSPTSPRFNYYVKNWDVAYKIRQAKLRCLTLDDYLSLTAANDARY